MTRPCAPVPDGLLRPLPCEGSSRDVTLETPRLFLAADNDLVAEGPSFADGTRARRTNVVPPNRGPQGQSLCRGSAAHHPSARRGRPDASVAVDVAPLACVAHRPVSPPGCPSEGPEDRVDPGSPRAVRSPATAPAAAAAAPALVLEPEAEAADVAAAELAFSTVDQPVGRSRVGGRTGGIFSQGSFLLPTEIAPPARWPSWHAAQGSVLSACMPACAFPQD